MSCHSLLVYSCIRFVIRLMWFAMTWLDRAGDNRLKWFIYKLQIGKPFSFYFSGLRNRLLTLRRKTEVFDLEFESNDLLNNALLYWLHDVFLLWFSGQTEWRESGYPAPRSGTPSCSLSRALSHSATFSDCFLVVLFSHLCPAEIGTFKTRTIKTLKYDTQSH